MLVLTGSTAGLGPSASMIAYSTAKAALHHMVRTFASQLFCSVQQTHFALQVLSVALDKTSFARDVRVLGLLPTSIGDFPPQC